MGIANKDLGKYNRPGIFINEIDNSIIELPVQNVLINLVPGFSKKGPVNRPVYVTSRNQFEQIFGSVDRGLERKSSYFHRTCIKMLQSGPIWALNLLSTNDTRDTVSWKSISCASAYDNASTSNMPYSRLFNRQDFWERDEETFLDYVNSPTEDTNRLLHVTNLGEKTITTFMYKSNITGFDVTVEDWYGGITKSPSYLHPKDWISDYMVSVIVLEGDWTNYETLSVDTTWGSYFTEEGLDKTKIQDFVDETNVTVVGYYDASLIPYFKDYNNRDMYIKNLINNDTDNTGLFCTFNEDLLLDSDYPTGKVDLIGDGVVGQETSTIDFLSYQETIIESMTYANTYLNTYGNVFGNYNTDMTTNKFHTTSGLDRIADQTNGYTDLSMGVSGTTLIKLLECYEGSGGTWLGIDVSYTSIDLSVDDVVYLNAAYGGLLANTPYYVRQVDSVYFTLSETLQGAEIYITPGVVTNLYVQKNKMDFTYGGLTPTYNLGGTAYTYDTDITTYNFEPLEFTSLSTGGTYEYDRYDVLYVSEGDDTISILKGTQSDNFDAVEPYFTTSLESSIILGYVHHYMESGATSDPRAEFIVKSDYTPVTVDNSGYVLLDAITMSGYTANNVNYIALTYGNTSGSTALNNYTQLRYRAVYDEMSDALDNGKGVIINNSTGYKLYVESASFVDYSTTYNASISIPIGTGDYTEYYIGTDTYAWLFYYIDNEFVVEDTDTDRLITTLAPVVDLALSGTSGYGAGVIGKYSTVYLNYYDGILNNGDFVYENNLTGATTRLFIKSWIEDTDKVYIDFRNSDGTSSQPIVDWTTNYTEGLIVWSNSSNYKQSLEIEYLDTSKLQGSVYEIKVDKNRYSEIIKGDFIEAYYDESLYISGGALFGYDPKKLARVIDITIDSTNTDWKVIRTDMPIKITTITNTSGNPDYQTMVYPQIDTYVDTYKGVKLTPFTIHADSIPNGTETRQSSILDIMSKTTNLAKGLVNKNKITWRYLVDSFGLGITANSKQQYGDLCGMKLNCLGFINAPSVKDLKKSTNPYFINDNDLTLDTSLLLTGGDETKSPSFLYSYAEGVGRSCIGYFFPYVTVDDLGTPKNVPPAAWCASTYMRKHTSASGAIQPWTIAAGISNGRVIDIADVEMDFSDDDLANLYQMNLNPIVKKRNAGYCINSESTAQVFPYSSLSIIHSREVLIELENSLYDMLLRYQWRFNTAEIRAEIKFRADRICKDLQEKNALYDFRNIIDETNNTNYIIDLQMGVLDTYIEIIKGMGTIVNNITILKKGDIESGGFQ